MKRKSFETYLFSGIGVIAVLLLIVAVNFLAGLFKQRVDLTQEKAYTLSKGTREILAKVDTPIQIRLYVSQGDNAMPVLLKTYAKRVEDLLGEYQQATKGLIEVKKLNPEPDSDAEDSAKLDGIDGQMLPNGEKIYLGLCVSMLDQKQTIPFLAPTRERLLEYEVSRAISRVMTSERPVIGLMSPLPVTGEMNPMLMQMGQGGKPPWVLYNELKGDFTVRALPLTTEEIPSDIKVLIVIHPKGISDQAQYAIDQFILRGGKVVAFLDPSSPLENRDPMMMGDTASTLSKLLPAWGMTFDTNKVVADLVYLGETRQGREPAVLVLTEKALNHEDVVTADADNAVILFSGAFTGAPVEGLKETVLIKSSKDSELIDAMSARMGGENIIKGFKPSGVEYPLAIRLTGKFKTAFPNGKPMPAASDAKKKPDTAKDTSLKKSTAETSVILFGDSDMIQDPVAVQQLETPFGQRLIIPANGNLSIAQAAIENLAGDNNLISIRSRASRERPFTVVREMQSKAEENYRTKIAQLEASLAETERRLSTLQQSKEGNQQFILSPEQQQELVNFRKKEAEVRKELKSVRRDLRADIDALETRVKWINIAIMPALVAIAGLGLAAWRRKRSTAR